MEESLMQQIYEVIIENNTETLSSLIKSNNIDINSIFYKNDPILHIAVMNCKRKAVRSLIKNGANPDIRNQNGDTALHYASDKSIAEMLIKKSSNIDAQNNQKMTPLHMASYRGNKDVILALLSAGAQIDIKNSDGDTALHIATISCRRNDISRILIQNGADVNATNLHGSTPLHRAIIDDSEIVDLLIAHGAKIDKTDNYGRSAMHMAALSGAMNAIDRFIKEDANINLRDNDQKTPLFYLLFNPEKGKTILMAQKMINAGAEVNAADSTKNTVLHYCVIYNKNYLFDILIKAGADVNAQNEQGNTPAHEAAIQLKYDDVMYLANNGANPYIRNNIGKTVLDFVFQPNKRTQIESQYHNWLALQKVTANDANEANNINRQRVRAI